MNLFLYATFAKQISFFKNIGSGNHSIILLASITVLTIVTVFFFSNIKRINGPVIHSYSAREPAWLTRVLFVKNAWKNITDGYNQVFLLEE